MHTSGTSGAAGHLLVVVEQLLMTFGTFSTEIVFLPLLSMARRDNLELTQTAPPSPRPTIMGTSKLLTLKMAARLRP